MCSEPWPSELTVNTASRTVDMVWDGAPATLAHQRLRASCRCSGCESRRRAGVLADAPGVTVERIEVLGATGLQLFFSDGHERGIYPWPYLYQLAYERPLS